MHLRWELTPAPERRRLRRGRTLNGVHAVAIRRQLAWAKEFAQAGDRRLLLVEGLRVSGVATDSRPPGAEAPARRQDGSLA